MSIGGRYEKGMTNPTENKEIVRRLFEDGFNRDETALVERLVAPEYVDAAGERGPGAFRQVMTRLRGAFPDLTYTLDELLAEGDRVAVRWHWTGTHQGPFRGLSPTQRPVTNTGAAIFRIRGGQIVAASLETDRLGFLQSIGVVPATDTLFTPPTAA
jgi:predicted ester cyclase